MLRPIGWHLILLKGCYHRPFRFMPSLVIHFARFGPYHLARIDAAHRVLSKSGWQVIGLETAGSDETYAWQKEGGERDWARYTIFQNETAEGVDAKRMRAGVKTQLDQLTPDAVAVAGWGSSDARACADWCRKNKVPAIVMSETRKADGVRVWWKEWIKARLIRRFDGALVGGQSHVEYLVSLGFPRQKIQLGYNVVDNGYFESESRKWRLCDSDCSRAYFLASSRFIGRKNLELLIRAFAKSQRIGFGGFDLCLLGDGPEKKVLLGRCKELGLTITELAPWEDEAEESDDRPTVYFPGFRQIEELPRFYAHAACFVHPALEEPWGLVINEAMACGLPIVSSNNVGAAEELVDEGVNGWTFSPIVPDDLADAIEKVTELTDQERQRMGQESRRILRERASSEAFGTGLLNEIENFLSRLD